ncbi:MAG: hypothetical protein QOE44_3055 [Solirubrobacteraceae bacterium]|jgi:hypothetical protein|nr:hypothetical protein [Solirubrobacteraceae bacterium]
MAGDGSVLRVRTRLAPAWLRRASDVLFYGYVGLMVVAGAWGVVFGRFDQSRLLGLDLDRLAPRTEANVMTQYRFLRAIELGFGLFAILYKEPIYQKRAFNRLFLFTMTAGVAGRGLSLRLDGTPSPIMYVFGGWEVLGVGVIYAYTRTTLED